MKDFYIGYLPNAPEPVARLFRVVAAALLLAAGGSAIVISAFQNPFAASVFEFGQPRVFEGTVELDPYPTLVVGRPGRAEAGASRYLLVGEGKHGANPVVGTYRGQAVRLRGALIYRDGRTMIEVLSGSVTPIDASRPGETTPVNLGQFELAGEIVDSKCYLGVMNPGNGKVHHDCAVRCLDGGIPPSFAVPDFRGSAAIFLLTDPAGKALAKEAFRGRVAKPVRIRGNASQLGDTLFLAVEPSGIVSAS
jgi:hypothetical protein